MKQHAERKKKSNDLQTVGYLEMKSKLFKAEKFSDWNN